MEKGNAVRDNVQEHRFEMTLGEGKSAFINYTEADAAVLALTHTEVPGEFEGKGIGSALVKGTFEIIRAKGMKFVPRCQFVSAYLRRHPEYQSLVANDEG